MDKILLVFLVLIFSLRGRKRTVAMCSFVNRNGENSTQCGHHKCSGDRCKFFETLGERDIMPQLSFIFSKYKSRILSILLIVNLSKI